MVWWVRKSHGVGVEAGRMVGAVGAVGAMGAMGVISAMGKYERWEEAFRMSFGRNES